MDTINYIAIYLFCGLLFALGFEALMKRMDTPGREDTKNWQRTVWIIAWPYFVFKFITGYYGED